MSSKLEFDQGIEGLKTDKLDVMLLPERVRYSLRAKKTALAAIEKSSGLKLPRKIGGSVMKPNQFVMCLGPDEWFVIAESKEKTRLDTAFKKLEKAFTLSITEVSHRNICFGIRGEKFQDAVNVGCPLDLSLEAFPVGKCTRTVFEAMPIILMRTGEDHFGIECWRSYGPYFMGFMHRFAADIN